MEASAVASKKKPRSGCLLWAAGLVLLFVVLAFIFRGPLLTALADGLIINDPPTPAGLIFLLNGDFNTRPFKAAELYRQKLAPRIVIAYSEDSPAVKLGLLPNDTNIAVGVLEHSGVPPADILVLKTPGGVTSTFDEATALHSYLEAHPVDKVILVTSAFHSRRARWIFERELAGQSVTLEMVAVPYSTFDKTNWWTTENGLITLNNEYIKLFYYLLKY